MFKRLRNKFILLNMVIISVLMLVSFGVIYGMTYTNIKNENAAKLQRVASPLMLRDRQPFLQEGGTVAGVTLAPSDYLLSFDVLTDAQGNIINVHAFAEIEDEFLENAVAFALDKGTDSAVITLNGRRWLFAAEHLDNLLLIPGGAVSVAILLEDCTQISFLDITDSQRTLSQLLITLGAIGFLMLFVIFGISVFFAKGAVAPVETAYFKQKCFIADASHELKTPISSVSANIDALTANEEETVGSQKKWINYIRAENERMSKLVGDMLLLAKTDGAEAEDTENLPFSLSDTVRDSVLSMEAVAYERGLALGQDIEPELFANGDSGKLTQVVKILLDNAVKYSEEGGKIEVSLRRTKHQAVLSVRNTGEGIAPEHLPKVFDRFYRADASRAYEGGCGLGLSIAKALVDAMGGTIRAESVEGEYAEFTVELKIFL